MSTKINNLLVGFENKWVALTPDRKKVITFDKDFKKLSEKLDKMKIGEDKAIFHFVLPFDRTHSFPISL